MARIHPSFPLQAPAHLGTYRERDILRMLEQGLDNRFDVFHNLPWSGMQGEQQSFGEYDFVSNCANWPKTATARLPSGLWMYWKSALATTLG